MQVLLLLVACLHMVVDGIWGNWRLKVEKIMGIYFPQKKAVEH